MTLEYLEGVNSELLKLIWYEVAFLVGWFMGEIKWRR